MKNLFTLTLLLALGAPASAETAAPQLQPINAAAARALPLETGNIKAAPAKDFFGGLSVAPVEDADYICQDGGGGYAIRAAGRSPKIWQLDGLASGAEEGIQLNKVTVDLAGMPQRLEAAGYLSFGGQELKIDLSLKRDQKTGGMALTALLGGQAGPLADVPCRTASAPKAFGAGPRLYAEGTLFSYDRSTKKYDQPTGRACSVTLDNFKSYLDTEHGSPREVVTARYRLEGFPGNGGWTSGTATGGIPSAEFPYVNFEGYQSGGLVTGTDVNILVDDVPSLQALLAGQVRPTDVYAVKENSASSYFGGDGVKWGYRCALPGGRP